MTKPAKRWITIKSCNGRWINSFYGAVPYQYDMRFWIII